MRTVFATRHPPSHRLGLATLYPLWPRAFQNSGKDWKRTRGYLLRLGGGPYANVDHFLRAPCRVSMILGDGDNPRKRDDHTYNSQIASIAFFMNFGSGS